jgi:hypothetical protein
MAAPPSDPSVDDLSSDTSLPANDAAPSSGRAVSAVAEEAPPSSGVSLGRMHAALLQFLASREEKKGRDWIRRVIVNKLGPDLEAALLDDLLQLAEARALEAKSPPVFEWGIPGWVARVTRCAIADYFRNKKDDDENLEPDAVAADQLERHAPETDWGAREHLICKWLRKEIGDDPIKVKTFAMMMEVNVVGRPVAEVAAENHMTASALSNRMHKLRKELAPRMALMDQEKPRRAILLLLFLFGAGVLAAILYLLLRGPTPVAPTATPALRPAPTTTASVVVPTFDNALPTQPSASPDDNGGKPQRPKP